MKKIVILLIILAMVLSGCGQLSKTAAQEKTVEYTDSLGRTVTVPEKITKIAISGPLSQVYILPLAGDMLVGVSNAICNQFNSLHYCFWVV